MLLKLQAGKPKPGTSVTSLNEKEQCILCRYIGQSFDKGLKRTAKSNFGGGNTRWEEKALGSYAFSESRLIEIMEEVCDYKGEQPALGCHRMLEDLEELIEKWWFKYYAKGKYTGLTQYMCIDKLEICCPNGTYGQHCKECQGGTERPCNGNGKCIGDGHREGTGACQCDDGYKGMLCDECKDGYYLADRNKTHYICKKCNESCATSCWGDGIEGCDDCKDGWTYEEDKGCIDTDECEFTSPCQDDEFCLNTLGSHKCQKCNSHCIGCTGPTAADCIECADMHVRENGTCQNCHLACENTCQDTTAKTCDSCSTGWDSDAELGCIDIDECERGTAECEEKEYCFNEEGSYSCHACHLTCKSCTGSSASDCKECQDGYLKDEENVCKDIDECADGTERCGAEERCVNLPGSFQCDCAGGKVRAGDKCVEAPKVIKSSKSKKEVKEPKKTTSAKGNKEPAPKKKAKISKSSKKSKKSRKSTKDEL